MSARRTFAAPRVSARRACLLVAVLLAASLPAVSAQPLAWVYQGCFADFLYGVRTMAFTANGGPGATQLGYSQINAVSDCEAWAVSNGLDTVGLQYGGQVRTAACGGVRRWAWAHQKALNIASPDLCRLLAVLRLLVHGFDGVCLYVPRRGHVRYGRQPAGLWLLQPRLSAAGARVAAAQSPASFARASAAAGAVAPPCVAPASAPPPGAARPFAAAAVAAPALAISIAQPVAAAAAPPAKHSAAAVAASAAAVAAPAPSGRARVVVSRRVCGRHLGRADDDVHSQLRAGRNTARVRADQCSL